MLPTLGLPTNMDIEYTKLTDMSVLDNRRSKIPKFRFCQSPGQRLRNDCTTCMKFSIPSLPSVKFNCLFGFMQVHEPPPVFKSKQLNCSRLPTFLYKI